MTNNNPSETLYEKVLTEQQKYREWLMSQPPDEILNHCYEYTVREDIVMAMEEIELSNKQYEALLKSPTPLADVYKTFSSWELGHMETIRDAIESRANTVIRQEYLKNQRETR